MKATLFDAVGGLPVLEKVHKIFYDKVYAHPWLGQFFEGHSQEAIENRQTQFMAEKMGGDVRYPGRDAQLAHRHMYITDELFDLRADILRESLAEAGVPDHLAERWLKIDNALRSQIVKKSVAEFYGTTWKYQKRVFVAKPEAESA